MKNKKLDTLISLSPFVIAALVPIGRFIFGKILKNNQRKNLNKKNQ